MRGIFFLHLLRFVVVSILLAIVLLINFFTMKKTYMLLAALVISATAFGQQKTAESHGAVEPVRDLDNFDGRAVIWNEDFASGIPATWSNVTLSGPVDWKYTTVGHTGAYPSASLLSPTSGNGWIIVDSDGDNFSGGGNEDAQLTTDVIDCSGVTGPIKLEFAQYHREWQADITTVRVTTDGGSSWTDWEVNNGVGQAGTPNPDIVTIDITTAIAGNPANVQVMFWWQGAWDYGWQIDDISIAEILPNDVRQYNEELSSGEGTYWETPLAQVKPLTMAADISNIGINSASNVGLSVDVNSGSFTSTSATATLAAGDVQNFAVANSFTPSAVGNYTVDFTTAMDSVDDEMANNSFSTSFDVTDSVYAFNNGNYAGQWWDQDDGNGSSNAFLAGCVYEVYADDVATSISAFIGDNSAVGAVLTMHLWELNPVDTSYILVQSTDSYDLLAGDLDGWVTLGLSPAVPVTTSVGQYLVTVEHFGGPSAIWIGYGSNAGGGGYTLSSDDGGITWGNNPRAYMVNLNLSENHVGIEDLNSNVALGQNMPNPFSTTTTINYELNTASAVTFEVVDVTGKVIYTSFEGSKSAGAHNMNFNAETIGAGLYFYSIITAEGRTTRQMVVTK